MKGRICVICTPLALVARVHYVGIEVVVRTRSVPDSFRDWVYS
jgi:hypothetical protein